MYGGHGTVCPVTCQVPGACPPSERLPGPASAGAAARAGGLRLGEGIVQELIGMITSADLKPGDRLPSERDLMRRLGVGRSTLREAVKALQAMGMVDVLVGDGMFVGRGGLAVLVADLEEPCCRRLCAKGREPRRWLVVRQVSSVARGSP